MLSKFSVKNLIRYAIVLTTYPGASPEEVEMTGTKPIERSMAIISNISNIQSTSEENVFAVMLEFDQTANRILLRLK